VTEFLDGLPTDVLFHRCWTQCVESHDYDKAVWKALQKRLESEPPPPPPPPPPPKVDPYPQDYLELFLAQAVVSLRRSQSESKDETSITHPAVARMLARDMERGAWSRMTKLMLQVAVGTIVAELARGPLARSAANGGNPDAG